MVDGTERRHKIVHMRTKVTGGTMLAIDRPLNSEEAAAYCRLHVVTIRNLARVGKLKSYRPGGHWRFYTNDLDRYIRGDYAT